MAEVRIMQTSRGGVKLVYSDYQYTKHKNNSNGTASWRCCARPHPARLRTQLGPDYRNPVVLGQHNHLGNPMMADVLQTCHEMKECAATAGICIVRHLPGAAASSSIHKDIVLILWGAH